MRFNIKWSSLQSRSGKNYCLLKSKSVSVSDLILMPFPLQFIFIKMFLTSQLDFSALFFRGRWGGGTKVSFPKNYANTKKLNARMSSDKIFLLENILKLRSKITKSTKKSYKNSSCFSIKQKYQSKDFPAKDFLNSQTKLTHLTLNLHFNNKQN